MYVRYIRLRWRVTFMKRWEFQCCGLFVMCVTSKPNFPSSFQITCAGRSQDWVDGASTKECSGTGDVTKWDIEKHWVLRVERFGRHGVGKLWHNNWHYLFHSHTFSLHWRTRRYFASLLGYSRRHILHPVQLFHGTVHGGCAILERLQGAQQKQKGQEYIMDTIVQLWRIEDRLHAHHEYRWWSI